MHDALAPRGPDGEGVWLDGTAALVHRRLAIIDLSELGAQPMRDDALGLVVVFNAVIDRKKGYFPVPALTHLEEPVVGMIREALVAPQARERGLFRADVVEAMLADPNAHRTNLDGSSSWQLALLELWLQQHVG